MEWRNSSQNWEEIQVGFFFYLDITKLACRRCSRNNDENLLSFFYAHTILKFGLFFLGMFFRVLLCVGPSFWVLRLGFRVKLWIILKRITERIGLSL